MRRWAMERVEQCASTHLVDLPEDLTEAGGECVALLCEEGMSGLSAFELAFREAEIHPCRTVRPGSAYEWETGQGKADKPSAQKGG